MTPPYKQITIEREIARQLQVWQQGVRYEYDFWNRYLAARGAPWQQDFERRMNPEAEVDCWLGGIVEDVGCDPTRVLDVGAGPICCLGKTMAGRQIDLVAVDPLAAVYDDLLSRHGVSPPIRTTFATGEDLNLVFEQESFDIIHCQNALDHSFDPIRVITQMLSVCRTGGYLLLRHAHNEAENESYSGLHQWNLTNNGNDLIVWNKGAHHCVQDILGDCVIGEMLLTEGYLINAFKKVRSFPGDHTVDCASRFLAFQKTMVDFFLQLERQTA